MIWLSNPRAGFVKSFQSYKKLCTYFNKLEYSKQESGQTEGEQWGFIYFPYAHIKILEEHKEVTQLSCLEQFAFERQLDLIEIHKGSTVYPEQIPVVPEINIQLLRRNWCWSYARHSKCLVWDEDLYDASEYREVNQSSDLVDLYIRAAPEYPVYQENHL